MTTDLVPRMVPIIGNRNSVMTAITTQAYRGRLLTPLADIKLHHRPDGKTEAAVMLLVPRRHDDTFSQVMKAFAFVLMILAASGGIVWAVVAAVGPGIILASVLMFALLTLAVVFNRASHSGACPGIAVHCKGCKH